MAQNISMSRLTGKKVQDSQYVYHVTKLIHSKTPDTQIIRILKERYGFEVSSPALAAFRQTYYRERLSEMLKFSEEFRSDQASKIQTYIDEALEQSNELKSTISTLQRQMQVVEDELKFVTKFSHLFRNAIDRYVESYDPDDPREFLVGSMSVAESTLAQAVQGMGQEGMALLREYVGSRSPIPLTQVLSSLSQKIKDHREVVVDIHKNIFKSYRNFSILQELSLIFEEYNGLIIEEFFPDRDKVDHEKYQRVRKKIFALFDKFNIRYQGPETPGQIPQSEINDPKTETPTPPPTKTQASKKADGRGRNPNSQANVRAAHKAARKQQVSPATEDLADEQVEAILQEVHNATALNLGEAEAKDTTK